MPLISIIVPVYNVEPYLPRCINSILSQSFGDFELILVNDGSSDGSGAICEEYARKDSRIHVIHQANAGPSVARNTALDWVFANSDSQWLTCIDSDDWVHPEYLATLYQAVLDTKLPISSCGYIKTNGEESSIDPHSLTADFLNAEDFFVKRNVNAIVVWGKLYRREFFRNIRYPAGKIHEDESITYKLLFSIGTVAYVDAPLYSYYQNPKSIMGSPWSPKRLDMLPAIYGRLSFFRRNHYEGAYLFQTEQLLRISMLYLQRISEGCHPDIQKKHKRFALRYYRKALSLCRKTGQFPFHKYFYLYETAYPRAMALYWNIKGILAKLRKGS